MSQRDLVAELRAARPIAPAELRERVRLIAAGDAPRAAAPRSPGAARSSSRVPVAAAVAAAVVLTAARRHAAPTGEPSPPP